MKIIRYSDSNAIVHYGALRPDGGARRIAGDVFGAFTVTDEPAQVAKAMLS